VPPENPPERGAETPELAPLLVPPLPALAALDPAELLELLDDAELAAPLLALRLVTALPAPVPPALPLTADCTPVTRIAGGLAVSEMEPPVTLGAEALPEPVLGD
jgi:hypothetical protein